MMPQMLSSLQSSSEMILPLVAGLAVFTLLLIIRRLLRRMGGIRGFGIAYLLGALGLGVAVGATVLAIEQGQSIDLTFRSVLLAILVCSWGLVALGLIEHLLLKNVIAGIALQTERPFDVGHWVEINKQTGRVVEMSWRATRVITVDGNYVIFPKANLAQAELINYTLGSPIQAMHVQIGIGYSHPPNLVKQVLTAAALASPDVCREPPPSIKLIQYGDYSVTYDIKFWLYNYDKYPAKLDAV